MTYIYSKKESPVSDNAQLDLNILRNIEKYRILENGVKDTPLSRSEINQILLHLNKEYQNDLLGAMKLDFMFNCSQMFGVDEDFSKKEKIKRFFGKFKNAIAFNLQHEYIRVTVACLSMILLGTIGAFVNIYNMNALFVFFVAIIIFFLSCLLLIFLCTVKEDNDIWSGSILSIDDKGVNLFLKAYDVDLIKLSKFQLPEIKNFLLMVKSCNYSFSNKGEDLDLSLVNKGLYWVKVLEDNNSTADYLSEAEFCLKRCITEITLNMKSFMKNNYFSGKELEGVFKTINGDNELYFNNVRARKSEFMHKLKNSKRYSIRKFYD